MAKDLCTYAIRNLRQERILRDHATEHRRQRYPRDWCARWGQRDDTCTGARPTRDAHHSPAGVLPARSVVPATGAACEIGDRPECGPYRNERRLAGARWGGLAGATGGGGARWARASRRGGCAAGDWRGRDGAGMLARRMYCRRLARACWRGCSLGDEGVDDEAVEQGRGDAG